VSCGEKIGAEKKGNEEALILFIAFTGQKGNGATHGDLKGKGGKKNLEMKM